jgi:hypothetical protein
MQTDSPASSYPEEMNLADPSRRVGPARDGSELRLEPAVVDALESRLPSVAEATVAAVSAEVPAYAEGLGEPMATGIAAGVRMALAAFLRLVADSTDRTISAARDAATDGAYELGRTEARAGRTVDALLAAYRVGARTAWGELSRTLVAMQVRPADVAAFAGLVFAYIDELSAASAAGHRAQLASTARVRARYLHELGQALLAGEPADVLAARAERADWTPAGSLTVVLVPVARLHEVASLLDPRTLTVTDERSADTLPTDTGVLLVPDAARTRATLLRTLAGYGAVVGPARPWTDAATSYRRAVRARALATPARGRPIDTEEHLPELVLGADPAALADLRRRTLAPLDGLSDAARARLTATLRSWLLHLGRRADVAADLGIHPQTVAYRMAQVRERFSTDLDDPEVVVELVLALAHDDHRAAASTP